jgi:hypothetical protein
VLAACCSGPTKIQLFGIAKWQNRAISGWV